MLVVVLIVGILAAIAVPRFSSTTEKASAVSAKELARDAATAAETIALDHGGSYAYVTLAEVAAEEPSDPGRAVRGPRIPSASPRPTAKRILGGPPTATNGDELTLAKETPTGRPEPHLSRPDPPTRAAFYLEAKSSGW